MADHSRSLAVLVRIDARAWAQQMGCSLLEASQFAHWIIERYPDSRFRPTFEEAKTEYDREDAR